MESSIDLQINEIETPCENCNQFQCTCQGEIENYNQTITIFKYKDFKIKLSPVFSLKYVSVIVFQFLVFTLLLYVFTGFLNSMVLISTMELEYNNIIVFFSALMGYLAIRTFLYIMKITELIMRRIRDIFIFEGYLILDW